MSFNTRWMIGCITLAVVSAVLLVVSAMAGETANAAVCCAASIAALVGCYCTPREAGVDR